MKLNVKTIYFALVSLVSILVLAFEGASLVQHSIYLVFPDLVIQDLQTLREVFEGEEKIPSFELAKLSPLRSDVLRETILVIIFGGLLIWHLPRLLQAR